MDESVYTRDWTLFLEMVRAYPVRTLIFTFGLPIFALVQLLNGYVNEAQVGIIAGFALLVLAYTVTLTRYQLAVYRRRLLTNQCSR